MKQEIIRTIEVVGFVFCLFFVAYIFIGCEKQDPTVERYGQKEMVCEDNNLYMVTIGIEKKLVKKNGCKDGKIVIEKEF